MSQDSVIVLDTTVLSNFARSNSVDWLVNEFSQLRTVPAVETELSAGVEAGYTYLNSASQHLGPGAIIVESDLPALPGEFAPILATLDRGEAEALVAAEFTGGVLATDDGPARSLARKRGINVTGSIGLLVRGIVRGGLSETTAQSWLETWIHDEDYYSPVDHISEALPDDS